MFLVDSTTHYLPAIPLLPAMPLAQGSRCNGTPMLLFGNAMQ